MTNKETAEFFRQRDHFLIVNHRRPDGDAVGSAAALCLGLRALGKTAHIWYNPQTTERYRPYVADLETDAVPEGAVIVSVDMATEGLLPLNGTQFAGRFALSIDHHMSNDGYARRTNVQPQCAACGQLLLEILQELGAVTVEMANAAVSGCLYRHWLLSVFQCHRRYIAGGGNIEGTRGGHLFHQQGHVRHKDHCPPCGWRLL